MNRMAEPSTWAGLALLAQALAQLTASAGRDPAAWAAVAGGLAAVVLPERSRP